MLEEDYNQALLELLSDSDKFSKNNIGKNIEEIRNIFEFAYNQVQKHHGDGQDVNKGTSKGTLSEFIARFQKATAFIADAELDPLRIEQRQYIGEIARKFYTETSPCDNAPMAPSQPLHNLSNTRGSEKDHPANPELTTEKKLVSIALCSNSTLLRRRAAKAPINPNTFLNQSNTMPPKDEGLAYS